MNSTTLGPMAPIASAISRLTVNKTASQRGTARLRHSANPITTGAAYSEAKYTYAAT
jgi:hypothetical protein